MGNPYEGSINLTIEMDLQEDLTDLDTIQVQIQRKDGTTFSVTPTVDDVLTGIVSYETVDGDLNQNGIYRVQAHVWFTDGSYYPSQVAEFEVSGLFEL